jgi:RNA polymerase sigma-70 factor (ECF subfamily)
MGRDAADEDLMLRAKAGDAEAFAALYHRHKEPLLSFCFRMLHNWEDAADVLQDAFRYVHAHAATYRPTARFSTYLTHIARNMCIDILRRRRRWNLQQFDPGIDVPDDAPDRGTPLEREEVEASIQRALDEVPEPYREVLHLRIVQDLPYEEIAQVVDCPVGTVKSRLHSGLAMLRQALKRRKISE